eukprot:4246015-Amphidinium_carterae.1
MSFGTFSVGADVPECFSDILKWKAVNYVSCVLTLSVSLGVNFHHLKAVLQQMVVNNGGLHAMAKKSGNVQSLAALHMEWP